MSEPKEQNEQLMRAYAVCFGSAPGQIVLTDLVPYCRGAETSFVPDSSHMSAFLEGRRDVLLRILQFSNIPLDELLELRRGRIHPKINGEE